MRATLVVVLLLGMVDVGEAGFSGAQPNAGAMAVLLGFEALVAINRERTPREMPATSLAVSRTDGTLRITNRSARHIYLLEGFGCPNSRTFTTECEKIAEVSPPVDAAGRVGDDQGCGRQSVSRARLPARSERDVAAATRVHRQSNVYRCALTPRPAMSVQRCAGGDLTRSG